MNTIVLQKPENIPARIMYNIMAGGISNRQMKSLAGQGKVKADAIVIVESLTSDNEPYRYVVIEVNGESHRTSSPSFMRGVEAYLKCFDPDVPFEFEVEIGRSSSGREFITFSPVFEEV